MTTGLSRSWCEARIPSAVPRLVELLKDEDPKVRLPSAWVLARLEPRARDAAPALKLLLDDADGCVRVAAADALILLGCEDSACEPLLLDHSSTMIDASDCWPRNV